MWEFANLVGVSGESWDDILQSISSRYDLTSVESQTGCDVLNRA